MRLSILLVLTLLLAPFRGFCQSYSSLRSHFVEALFSDDADRYKHDVESFIEDPENAAQKADAEALLSVFKLLNDDTSEQPYVCQFNQAMREVGLTYSAAATTNPYLQILKVKVNGRYVVILKNTHRQSGYMANFTGASLDKTSTSRISRGIGLYSCARMTRTDKPFSYAYAGAKKSEYLSNETVPCP
ncbi:hypothetical protein AUC43_09565 [Hymenobacter sedentarius]|uniref:Uncharacterized protein n=1 Tax=Hymenobacter sedentarius TaxID=1411621 RepID=A0A0U4CAW7_9BACT|nr:hypothetical protein [Hymenobacter sedentarius]ALW85321.1 hypothetical protein AUC43_09565 [Hymenobacter sedentarius]